MLPVDVNQVEAPPDRASLEHRESLIEWNMAGYAGARTDTSFSELILTACRGCIGKLG